MVNRILVADDNDCNYLLVKAILKGYTLVRAVNGVEAVKLTKESSFDVVLMDIKMPIMDGLEATMKIREYNETIPIIAITANVYDSDRIAAIDAGCNGFVAKPFSKNELLEILYELENTKSNILENGTSK